MSTPAPPADAIGKAAISGGVWSVLGRTLPLAYTLVVSVVAARVLGPTILGQLALITFASASATVLLSGAPAAALMRTISEARGRGDDAAIRGLVPPALAAATALSVVAMLLFVGIAVVADTNETAWLLAGAWSVTTLLHTVPSAFLAAVQRWRDATIVGLTTGVVHVGISLAVLAAGGGLTALLAVDAAIGVVNIIGTGFLARRLIRELPRATRETADLRPRIVRYALGTTPAVWLAYVLERRSELFFLALFAGSAQAALYAIPFSALSVLALVPTAIGLVTATAVASLIGANAPERIQTGHERAVRLTLLLALPLTAGGVVVGPSLLHAVYGEGYGGTGPVLVILLAALPLIVLTSLEVALLQGLGRARDQVLIYSWAAAANVALALLLVPRYEAIGAALAHSGAYVVAVIVTAARARSSLGPVGRGLRPLVPAVVASALAGATAYPLVRSLPDGAGAAAGMLAGALVFLILARALRVVPREDATWIAGHFPGTPGRLAVALSRPIVPQRTSAP